MYREVTDVRSESKRSCSSGRGAPPEEADAPPARLDPKTVRRYLRAAAAAGVRVRATMTAAGGPPGPARVCTPQAVSHAVTAGRGVSSSAPRWSVRSAMASGSRRFASCSSATESGMRVCHAPPLRGSLSCSFGKPRRRFPCSMASPVRSCSLIRAGLGSLMLQKRQRRRRFAPSSFPRCASATASSPPASTKRPRAQIEACERASRFRQHNLDHHPGSSRRPSSRGGDPLNDPPITPVFLECTQAPHFISTQHGCEHAHDKGRVERAVPGGPRRLLCQRDPRRARGRTHPQRALVPRGLRPPAAQSRAARTTRAFQTEEQGMLLPAPTAPYDIPL